MRRWFVAAAVAAGCAGLNAAAAAAFPGRHAASVSVGGAVTTPATYSEAQLGAMPQTTFTVTEHEWWRTRTHSDTGVSVEDLVNAAAPTLPSAKNAMLRVTVTVAGAFGRSVTLALGELDPSFGDHPAYLALTQDGHPLDAPELVVPEDRFGLRSVEDVSRITVGVQSPAPTTPPSSGALTVVDGTHSRRPHRGPARGAALRDAAGHLPGRHHAAVAHRDRAEPRHRPARGSRAQRSEHLGGRRRLRRLRRGGDPGRAVGGSAASCRSRSTRTGRRWPSRGWSSTVTSRAAATCPTSSTSWSATY